MPPAACASVEGYHRLLSPRVVALVTALAPDNKPNTMVAVWHSPVSLHPPILAVAISPLRYTHKLILSASEFTLCIPPRSMLEQVEEAGSTSGNEVDKSALFSYYPAQKVKTPLIEGSLGTVECTLNRALMMGDHSVVFGNVVCSTSEGMGSVWGVSPLLHVGLNHYAEFTPIKKIIK